MSIETKAAFEEALKAHLIDEIGPAVPLNYVCQIAAVKPEDSEEITHYYRVCPTQPIHVTLGLIQYAQSNVTDNLRMWE